MTIERRRLAAKKAIDRVRHAGLPMEENPQFLSWIEEWVAGAIDMSEVRRRYVQLLQDRLTEHKARLAKGRSSPSELDLRPQMSSFGEQAKFLLSKIENEPAAASDD